MSIDEQEQAHVEDKRHNPFFSIDTAFVENYLPKIGLPGLGVYVVLCRHANQQRQCFPGVRYLGEKLGMSRASIFRAIKKLEDLKLVKRIPRKSQAGATLSTAYRLLNIECGENEEADGVSPMRGGGRTHEILGVAPVRRGGRTHEKQEVDPREVEKERSKERARDVKDVRSGEEEETEEQKRETRRLKALARHKFATPGGPAWEDLS